MPPFFLSNFAFYKNRDLMKEENIDLDVKGMSCTNCALTITKYLEKQGMGNVYVDFIQGKVKFSLEIGRAHV